MANWNSKRIRKSILVVTLSITNILSGLPIGYLQEAFKDSRVVDKLYLAGKAGRVVDMAFKMGVSEAKAESNSDGVIVYSERNSLNDGRYGPGNFKVFRSGAGTNGDGLAFYGIAGNSTPRTRSYSYTSNNFGSATSTVAAGTGVNSKMQTNPTKLEAVAGVVTSGGVLYVMCYDGTSWSNEWNVTVGGTGTTVRFDIEFETNSGDAMVVYSTNAGTTNELAYRTKAGSSACGSANWSGATNLDPVRTSGIVRWVKIARDKRSAQNLLAVTWADANSDVSASVWSGSAWGNEPTAAITTALEEITAAATDSTSLDIEYESSSGDFMIVHGSGGTNGTNGAFYSTCTGGIQGCTWTLSTAMPTFLDDATNLDLCSNYANDQLGFGSIGNAGSDLQVGYWSGSAWTNVANHDTAAATPVAGSKMVACGFLTNGATTRQIVIYNDSATQNIGYTAGNAGAFTTQTDATPVPLFDLTQYWYEIEVDPHHTSQLIATYSDASRQFFAKRLVMSSAPAYTWTNSDGSSALTDNDSHAPRFRDYLGSSNNFSAESAAAAPSSDMTGRNFRTRTSPTKLEAITAYQTQTGALHVMCFDGSTWTEDWTVSVGPDGIYRRFDVAYETNTGDVMVMYSTNTATTNELAYRTKAGSAACGSGNWSGATNFNPVRTAGIVHWVTLAWDKRSSSNLIGAIWADAASDLSAAVWDGSAWTNEPTAVMTAALEVAAAAQDVQSFDIEYEASSGDLLIAYGSGGTNGTNGAFYSTCTGGIAACTWTLSTAMPTFLDDATHIDISGYSGSDEIVFASIGNAGSDMQIGYWSGSAWTNTANVDITSATPVAGQMFVATGWVNNAGTIRSIVAYYDASATNIGFYYGNAGTFTVGTDFTTTPVFGVQRWYDIDVDPFDATRLFLTVSDVNYDVFGKRLVYGGGTTFTWTNSDSSAALETTSGVSTGVMYSHSFSFAYYRNVTTSGGSPTYTQSAFRWYVDNDNENVTDAWGNPDIAESAALTAIPATNQAPLSATELRLRMSLTVGTANLTASTQQFKLQYKAGTDGSCTTGSWTDVGAGGGGSIWRYATSGVTDGTTLTVSRLTPTDVRQVYSKASPTATNPNSATIGQDIEYDFHIEHNGAAEATTYAFRVVTSAGTVLDTYSVCPTLMTRPNGTRTMRHGKFFGDEIERGFVWSD